MLDIDTIGAIFGVVGAFLVAGTPKMRLIGFTSFIFANVFLFVWVPSDSVKTLYALYMISAICGIVTSIRTLRKKE